VISEQLAVLDLLFSFYIFAVNVARTTEEFPSNL